MEYATIPFKLVDKFINKAIKRSMDHFVPESDTIHRSMDHIYIWSFTYTKNRAYFKPLVFN